MQLVMILTGRFERSWRRKANEMVLAMLVTRHVPSGELPALYLSVGYYGWGMNDSSMLVVGCVSIRHAVRCRSQRWWLRD